MTADQYQLLVLLDDDPSAALSSWERRRETRIDSEKKGKKREKR
jgi:hypothetical protein